MASSNTDLSDLQRSLVEGLAGGRGFFLTGGAALSAFYLHHRQSQDLDLFAIDAQSLDELEQRLVQLCIERGWSSEAVRRFPGFRRYVVRDGADKTLIDMVHEPVAQIVALPDKPIHAGLHVDALSDLVANKLCALLGRGDIKDMVDLYFLDRAGVDLLAHVEPARAKDGGLEALTLSYVLRTAPTDPSRLLLIHPVTEADIAAFRDRFLDRLLAQAWPQGRPPEAEPDPVERTQGPR